jgi:hypothetical protein
MLGLVLLVILLFTIAAPACCAFKPSLYQGTSAGADAYDSAESSKISAKEAESAPGGQTSTSADAEAKNKEAIAEGRTYEAAFRASEGIYECEYLGRKKQENISFDNPPIANYRWVQCFKGPPFGYDLRVRFDFGQTTQDKMPAGWKFREDMMPARHSHWIIFLPNCVPEPGGFRTYMGSYGRQEASEKNISAIKAFVEKHHGEW